MLSFKRKLIKKIFYRIGIIKLEIWGGVVFVFFEKKYFDFICVISIEIKIEV